MLLCHHRDHPAIIHHHQPNFAACLTPRLRTGAPSDDGGFALPERRAHKSPATGPLSPLGPVKSPAPARYKSMHKRTRQERRRHRARRLPSPWTPSRRAPPPLPRTPRHRARSHESVSESPRWATVCDRSLLPPLGASGVSTEIAKLVCDLRAALARRAVHRGAEVLEKSNVCERAVFFVRIFVVADWLTTFGAVIRRPVASTGARAKG